MQLTATAAHAAPAAAAPAAIATLHRTQRVGGAPHLNPWEEHVVWLYELASSRLAAGSLGEAVRAAHAAAVARGPERPILGVRQAQDGAFELLELGEGNPFSGGGPTRLHSDALGHRGDGAPILERHERVTHGDSSLLALVGAAAWRDVRTNELQGF